MYRISVQKGEESMNKAILVGRLTRDPEVRYLYHEFKESNENKIRKELDELKKRIEELENNNR